VLTRYAEVIRQMYAGGGIVVPDLDVPAMS
jgi:hypothetical protein